MTIEEHRGDRRRADLLIKSMAAASYATYTANERTAVRFGMFPAEKMQALESDLKFLAESLDLFPMYDATDLARLAAVGVMDAANAGPDTLVV
jgi:hypothetical protein